MEREASRKTPLLSSADASVDAGVTMECTGVFVHATSSVVFVKVYFAAPDCSVRERACACVFVCVSTSLYLSWSLSVSLSLSRSLSLSLCIYGR